MIDSFIRYCVSAVIGDLITAVDAAATAAAAGGQTADFTMMNLRGDKSHVYKDAKNSLVSKDIAAVELQVSARARSR